MQTVLEELQEFGEIPIGIHAELDRRTMAFGELLDLKIGSLIALSKPTGENVDLYAGEVLLGCGEILLVDGNLTVRISDLRDTPVPPQHAGIRRVSRVNANYDE
jgi:flagellar motor switch/type III secretory pathway protein FliN